MNRRDPITYVYPRTLRDTRDTTYEWWSTAEAAAAEEQHIKAMFAEPSRPIKTPAHDKALYVIAAVVCALFILGIFK